VRCQYLLKSTDAAPGAKRNEFLAKIWISVRATSDLVFVSSDARLAPPVETVHTGRVRAIALGNIGPGRARPKPPENPVQNTAIINAGNAARLVRQQRLDHSPLEIRQIKTSHSNLADSGIPFMRLRPWGRDISPIEKSAHAPNPSADFATASNVDRSFDVRRCRNGTRQSSRLLALRTSILLRRAAGGPMALVRESWLLAQPLLCGRIPDEFRGCNVFETSQLRRDRRKCGSWR